MNIRSKLNPPSDDESLGCNCRHVYPDTWKGKLELCNPPPMAPRLSKIQRTELEKVIVSKLQGEEVITDEAIAKKIGRCTARTVRNARFNILKYGTTDAPRQAVTWPRDMTENMWLALQDRLNRHPCIT